MRGGGRDVTLIASFFSMSVIVGCLGAKEVEMKEDRLRGAAQRLKGEGVRSNGGVGMYAKMLTGSGKKTNKFAAM
jgi:hypothetical protein